MSKDVLELRTEGGARASIAVSRGLNCFALRLSAPGGTSVDVVEAEPGFGTGEGKATRNGVPILFPWPNRIRAARYRWDGRDYDLSDAPIGFDSAGNAAHGFCVDRQWRVVESGADFVVGQWQISRDAPELAEFWPGDGIITVEYRLKDSSLTMDIAVRNPSPEPFPFGFGTHAYFKLPLADGSDAGACTVSAPAASQWQLEASLPTGKIDQVGEDADLRGAPAAGALSLDHALTDLAAHRGMIATTVEDPSGVRLTQRFDASFKTLVAFTPPWSSSVCLEPYTCMTDAINLEARGIDSGLIVLAPGRGIPRGDRPLGRRRVAL